MVKYDTPQLWLNNEYDTYKDDVPKLNAHQNGMLCPTERTACCQKNN